jgi:hypothetical protein
VCLLVGLGHEDMRLKMYTLDIIYAFVAQDEQLDLCLTRKACVKGSARVVGF